MNRRRVLPFIALALAGAMSRPATAQKTHTPAALAGPGSNLAQNQEGPCDVIEKFAEARLHSPKGAQPLKLHFPCTLPEKLKLNFIIATVPNPIETHLALWFDRAVESIQNAAGSVGFRFQGAWVPWEPDLVRDEPDTEKRATQQREKRKKEAEPGLLMFRSPEGSRQVGACGSGSDLVVLLVPETPTGGIDSNVFKDAVEIAHRSEVPDKCEIQMLGPSFSGSFASLAKLLPIPPDKRKLKVTSGSAASSGAWKAAFESDPQQYSTTVHDIERLRETLVNHMEEWSKTTRIAFLSESETSFGWSAIRKSANDPDPLVLRYPRQISRLRNAYGDQELRVVVGAQPQPSFRNLLSFRFDTGPSSDSTPVLAKNQTPLSQDTVLEEIARTLERERVNLAGILATDIFDSLFIARYLREACPDVRLFTFDSDLLYVRGAEDFPFDGTLAVTTYPLMASNQGWTNLHRINRDGNDTRERILFSSRAAEGIYNAMRSLLLRSRDENPKDHTEQLVEYFSPACAPPSRIPDPDRLAACSTPPVWLTVVTRSGYWPLAVVEAEPAPDQGLAGGRLLSWPSSQNQPRFYSGPLPRLWRLFFAMISGLLAWHFVGLLVASLKGYRERREWSRLSIWPEDEGWIARFCYVSICSLSLLALYGLYIVPLIAISRHSPHLSYGGYWWAAIICFAIFVGLTFVPLLVLILSGKRHARERAGDAWNYGLLALALLFFAAFTYVVAVLFFPLSASNRGLTHEEMFFFAYRSLHLNSGVSPIVPLLILLGGFFIWAWVHLKRITTLYDRTPWLPSLGHTDELSALDTKRKDLERLVRDPLPMHWRTVGAFALIIGIWYYLTSPLQSFEYKPYDLSFLLTLSALYGLLFLTWGRFLLIWWTLRLFLEELERHPIRFVFSALPKQSAWSPLLQPTAGQRGFLTAGRIRESLRALRPHAAPVLADEITKLETHVDDILSRAVVGNRIPPRQNASLRNSLATIDRHIIGVLNESYWRDGHSSIDPASPAEERASASAVDPAHLAEEVIALQYIDYIRYTLHQLRNLLFFVTVGFVLSMTALHSYPFQAPKTITTFITIMFFIFAGGIIVVFAQADRDPTLSRITSTTPGELSGGFFLRTGAYLGLPFLTVIASQFPAWGRFLFSWVQPTLEALK